MYCCLQGHGSVGQLGAFKGRLHLVVLSSNHGHSVIQEPWIEAEMGELGLNRIGEKKSVELMKDMTVEEKEKERCVSYQRAREN
ncbi:hypothetical protein V6N13_080541 [Hibiscus sabdariffa]